jgi:hypothetical protein
MSQAMIADFALVSILFAVAVALLAMIQWLFVRVRREDPALFDRLGRPDLVTNNNVSGTFAVWSWIFSRPDRNTTSKGTRAIATILRIVSPLYVLAFLGMIVKSLAA